MTIQTAARNKAKTLRNIVPRLQLRAKSVYHQRSIINGSRLSCYAQGKATLKDFCELGAGNQAVDVETALTCLNVGTERAQFHRLPNTKVSFPYTPTCSGVGRVVKIGRGVSEFAVGDLVAGPFKSATIQSLPAKNLVRVAEDIPLEQAALLSLCNIAVQAIRMGRIQSGHRVVVLGQGVIGRLSTLLSRAEGAEVTCIVNRPEKLQILKESKGIALQQLPQRDVLDSLEADVVIDATGDPEAIHTAFRIARVGGRVVLLGSSRGVTNRLDWNGPAMQKQLTIVGAHRQNQPAMPAEIGMGFRAEMTRFQDKIRAGRLDPGSVITHRVDWYDLVRSYNDDIFDAKDACGVIVDWAKAPA